MNKKVKLILFLILIPALIINLTRYLSNDTFHRYMLDFKPVYVGTLILSKGQNPYDNINIESTWKDICIREGLPEKPGPGLPNNPFLYPPSALIFFYPLVYTDFKTATSVWLILNILFIAGILFLIASLGSFIHSKTDLLLLIILFFATKMSHHGIMVGQPLFFSYFFCLFALFLEQRKNPILAGIALTFGFVKYTIAFPFLIYFAVKKDFKVLISSIVLIVLSNLVFSVFIPIDVLSSYVDMVIHTTSLGQCNDFTPINHRFFDMTMVHTILYLVINNREIVFILAWTTAITILYIMFSRGKLDIGKPRVILVFFTFYSLLFINHRFIDILILLNVFLIMTPSKLLESIGWKSGLLIPLFFPITGLVLRFMGHMPEIVEKFLLLNVQVSLVIIFIMWLGQRRGHV